MKILKLLSGAVFAMLAMVAVTILAAAPAMAQTSEVSLQGLIAEALPYVRELLAALVVVAIGWVTMVFKTKLGVDIEARHREALHSAVMSGLNLAIAKGAEKAAGAKIDVGSASVAVAVQYIMNSVPDAIRFFGLTPDRLGELVRSKMPTAEDAEAKRATWAAAKVAYDAPAKTSARRAK